GRRDAGRRTPAYGSDRTLPRRAVHERPPAADPQICPLARRGTRAPGAARRRPSEPQSRGGRVAAAGSPAAAADIRGARPGAVAGADFRDRPDDADAALLPAR